MDETVPEVNRLEQALDPSEDLLTRRLVIAVIAIVVLLFIVAGALLFRYLQERNAAPRTKYDYETRIWKTEAAANPKSPRPHLNLGVIYFELGRNKDSLRELNLAVKLGKDSPVAWYHRGIVYRDMGEKKKAISDLRKAAGLGAYGSRYLPLFALGELYEKDKDYKKAAGFFQGAVEDQPIMWNSHYRLGKVLEKLGKDSKALVSYREAAKFNQEDSKIKAAIKRLTKE